ncbi:hypothetical protein EJ03DRAFT_343557 [Teratosphaeria nubilosa]|uniref:IEC3 subunit of the Ino80 complex, chromatin re-modelling-domain-containing protein n=1 Tax=Teratosphaeria nubilosa TaxID=161662 RepID=A0A6G1L9J8_9PEZI|nr:hypothetical protein EJ03DRAFT_343557 [Teratosphaeria nubilosa]
MKHRFDARLDHNKRLFREEQKLERLARRLREELDGLLDICLDLNDHSALPPDLRFNVRPKPRHAPPLHADPNITPDQAAATVEEYRQAVSAGRIPQIDHHIVRELMEQTLAAQGATPIEALDARVPYRPAVSDLALLPADLRADEPTSYMSPDHESDYLLRMDALSGTQLLPADEQAAMRAALGKEEKHFAHLTPRELERQTELLNPQSQHNWLKTHTKALQQSTQAGNGDMDDNESLASHDAPKLKRPRGGKKNLAQQVGDRAVAMAREADTEGDEDELSMLEDVPPTSAGKRKAKDPDSTYRVKGGKSGSSASKGKRKRSGEDVVEKAGNVVGGKKPKVNGEGS